MNKEKQIKINKFSAGLFMITLNYKLLKKEKEMIGEIRDFDPQVLQQLLATMSGGMAVALYTTLTGLITSMLLKFQYFVLDSDLSHTINYLSSKFIDEK